MIDLSVRFNPHTIERGQYKIEVGVKASDGWMLLILAVLEVEM